MIISYKPNGVCAKEIQFEVKDDIVQSVAFIGGCPGNATGVANLVKGMEIREVITRLQGIPCRHRQTSCPDQLAQALKEHYQYL